MSVSYCLPHPVAVSVFIICTGLCSCTEMLWMCVLYVSFWSKVRCKHFALKIIVLFFYLNICSSKHKLTFRTYNFFSFVSVNLGHKNY